MCQSRPGKWFVRIFASRAAIRRRRRRGGVLVVVHLLFIRQSSVVHNGVGERIEIGRRFGFQLFRVEATQVRPGPKGSLKDGGAMFKFPAAT